MESSIEAMITHVAMLTMVFLRSGCILGHVLLKIGTFRILLGYHSLIRDRRCLLSISAIREDALGP